MRIWLSIALFMAATPIVSGCDSVTPEEHLQRAREYIDAGEFNPAMIELKNTLQKAPENAEARYRLGIQYELGADYASAEKELQRALDLGYERSAIMTPLLRAQVYLGKTQEVLTALAKEQDPTPALVAIQGLALLRSGQIDEARATFERALEREEKTADALLGLARINAATDPEQALANLERVLQIDSARRDAWVAKGELEMQTGDPQQALTSFANAAELPGGEIVGGLGIVEAAVRTNDLDKAEAEVKELLRTFPGQPTAHYYLGLIEFHRGNLDSAIEALRFAERDMPNHLPTLLLLGTALAEQGSLGQGRQYLERYVAQAAPGSPQSSDARKRLAALYLQGDLPQEAITILTRDDAALDPSALSLLGSAYQQLENHSAAAIFLEQAVAMAPDRAQSRQQLAVSLLADGRPDEAMAELDRAADGGDPAIAATQIRVLLQQQRYEQAKTAAEAMIADAPELPAGHYLLGAAYLGLDDTDAAVAAFNGALAKDPAYTPAVVALAGIDLGSDRPDAALDRFRQLNERSPGDETAAMALVRDAMQRNDPERAIDVLQRARVSNPQALEVRIVLARLLLLNDQTGEAADVLDEASALSPDVIDVRLLSAQLDAAQGRNAQALRKIRALQADRDTLPREAVLLLARLEADGGNYDRSIEILSAWVTQEDDDLSARLLMGNQQMLAGRLDDARTTFEALQGELPENVMLLNNLATIYGRQQDDRAVEVARRAHELAPESPEVSDTLGWILFQDGQHEEAVTVLRTAYDREPHPTIGFHLASALAASGDAAAAVEVADRALQSPAFPEREETRALLDQLQQ